MAKPELQCYWESSEEDDSPNKANEAKMKRHNNIQESSSSDSVSDDEGEGMNINDNDDNHGTSNNLLQSKPLIEMPVCVPSPTSTKKTPMASSLENLVE